MNTPPSFATIFSSTVRMVNSNPSGPIRIGPEMWEPGDRTAAWTKKADQKIEKPTTEILAHAGGRITTSPFIGSSSSDRGAMVLRGPFTRPSHPGRSVESAARRGGRDASRSCDHRPAVRDPGRCRDRGDRVQRGQGHGP